MARRRRAGFALALGAILVFATLLLTEAALRVAASISQKADLFTRQYDELLKDADGLIAQGNPNWPDHDARGYRNPSALSRADVVAIGDSHTYGTNVAAVEPWPVRLAGLSHTTVYNMGLPGTGAQRSVASFRVAAELHPKTILFTLYFGNDFVDDFVWAFKKGGLAAFASPSERAEAEGAERAGPLADKIDALLMSGAPRLETVPEGSSNASAGQRVKLFLYRNSRLYGLMRSIRDHFSDRPAAAPILRARFDDAIAALTESQKPYISVFSGEGWRTILTSRYRLATLDQSDVRIALGLRSTQQAIKNMRDFCAGAGIAFAVVLMPTKEFVFQDHVKDASAQRDYIALLAAEGRARREIIEFLQGNGIAMIDPLPALRGSATQSYFENADGHPNAVGHQLIAAEVSSHLGADGTLRVR